MQRVTVTIPVDDFVPRDTFHVYGDASAAGLPLGSVDYDRPITGQSPVPFWPMAAEQPGYGEGVYGEGSYGGVPTETPADHEVVSPPLFWGVFLFAVKTFDAVGNASAGTPATRAMCSSPPVATSRLIPSS